MQLVQSLNNRAVGPLWSLWSGFTCFQFYVTVTVSVLLLICIHLCPYAAETFFLVNGKCLSYLVNTPTTRLTAPFFIVILPPTL